MISAENADQSTPASSQRTATPSSPCSASAAIRGRSSSVRSGSRWYVTSPTRMLLLLEDVVAAALVEAQLVRPDAEKRVRALHAEVGAVQPLHRACGSAVHRQHHR